MPHELEDATGMERVKKKITQDFWKNTSLGVVSKSGKGAFSGNEDGVGKKDVEGEPNTFKEQPLS